MYLSDAFCLTSVYEGLPISLLEAISCGCVPVCTPVGGITEVVHHEVRPGDPGRLHRVQPGRHQRRTGGRSGEPVERARGAAHGARQRRQAEVPRGCRVQGLRE